MEISKKGIDLIKKYEGCRLNAYRCPAKVLTIGYGHTNNVRENQKITQAEAEKLLKEDLIIHSNNVLKLTKAKLNQNQFDALVSLEFNIGYGNFKNSTLLKFLNQGKYTLASNQFDRWIYSKGKVLQGLVKRRKEEKELFLKIN